MSNLVEVIVPDIGNFDSVDVIEVLVKVGDTVAKEDSLITLESDKASMDIPSSDAGVVKEIKIKAQAQAAAPCHLTQKLIEFKSATRPCLLFFKHPTLSSSCLTQVAASSGEPSRRTVLKSSR
jgi:dihydrolipoamide dehydrogenase